PAAKPMRILASAIEINGCWSKMEGVAIGRHFGKMAHHELGPKANYADGSPPRLPSYYQGNLGVRSRNCESTRRLAARLHPAHVRFTDHQRERRQRCATRPGKLAQYVGARR